MKIYHGLSAQSTSTVTLEEGFFLFHNKRFWSIDSSENCANVVFFCLEKYLEIYILFRPEIFYRRNIVLIYC